MRPNDDERFMGKKMGPNSHTIFIVCGPRLYTGSTALLLLLLLCLRRIHQLPCWYRHITKEANFIKFNELFRKCFWPTRFPTFLYYHQYIGYMV